MAEAVAQRLAERALALARGDERVFAWLERFFPDAEREGDALVVTGTTGIRTAFVLGLDPVAALVALGYAFFGEAWPTLPVMRRAFALMHAGWKEETKRARAARRARPA
ncbi:MAG: hypothetical protein NZ761_01950 [Dehalococcoidia bacterium]|nr:hypothetical protein [Dehalococcoidia bacterium]